jgi:glutaredoxin 3
MEQVTIYTKSRCIYCIRARRRLRRAGATFREVRAAADIGQARERLRQQFDTDTFPQIVIAGRHIGGARELAELDKTGRLQRLLSEQQDATPSSPANGERSRGSGA